VSLNQWCQQTADDNRRRNGSHLAELEGTAVAASRSVTAKARDNAHSPAVRYAADDDYRAGCGHPELAVLALRHWSGLVSLLALVWLCITISVISHRLLRLMANLPEVPYVIPELPMKAVTLPNASRLSQWLNHPFLAGDEL
jgi:hypothetical protein